MVNLQDLPPELLLHTFSFLPGDPDDAFRVHASEEKFRHVAQPFLFRYLDNEDAADLKRTLLFTRALYTRPGLGEHVNFVSITLDFRPESRPRILPRDDFDIFQKVIRDLSLAVDDEGKWLSMLHTYDLNILLALLVNKSPNLRALRVPQGLFSMQPLVTLRKRKPSLLSNLEHFWSSACDVAMFPCSNIASFFEMLALPKMTAATFDYGHLFGPLFPTSWAPGTLSVEQLSFNRCHIDTTSLKRLFRACKKITSFSYQTQSYDADQEPDVNAGEPGEFNAAELHAAIPPHKDTLNRFHLEFWRDPFLIETIEGYQEYLSSRVKIPSFHDFPVLETMHIQHALLPPHPKFPRSLKTLRITDCNSSIREMVANIAKDCQNGAYPLLTIFTVFALDITRPIKLPGQRIPEGQTPEQCFWSLRNLFEGTNVDFQIVPYDVVPYLGDPLDEELTDEDDYEQYGYRMTMGERMVEMLMHESMQNRAYAGPEEHYEDIYGLR